MNLPTISILPFHLVPEAFGLRWGHTPTECQAILLGLPVPEGPSSTPISEWQSYSLSLQGCTLDVILGFDERGLGCVEAVTAESRDFWDYVEEEVREEIESAFIAGFMRAITIIMADLGPPDYQRTGGSSEDEMEEEPEEDTSLAPWLWIGASEWMQVYWDQGNTRLQLTMDQSDKEFPIQVRASVMRTD
jgi:hypothetical protein